MKPNGPSFSIRGRGRGPISAVRPGTLLLPRRRLIPRPVTTVEIPPGTLLRFCTDG
jgi:hypothetical protein